VLSLNVVLMCLLGGRHRFLGPLIGALIFTWGEQFLSEHTSSPDLYMGAGLLIIVLLAPEGLAQLPELLRRRPRPRSRRT
jgi:branched-chain amino acid transport system permease protein